MRTIYLHIGMHKTGSTSIQHAFADYDDGRLRYADLADANHSLLFYTLFSAQSDAHHIWTATGASPDRIRDYMAEYRTELGRVLCERPEVDLIFSGEDISAIDGDGIAELRSFLTPHAARIVVIAYVRRPLSHLRSQLQHLVSSARATTEIAPPHYRYLFEKFVDSFGPGNVVLREFEPSVLHQGDICADFAVLLGARSPPQTARLNASISTEAAKVIHLVDDLVPQAASVPQIAAARHAFCERIIALLPGPFDLPNTLIEGLISAPDILWLRDTSGLDFTDEIPNSPRDFDVSALHEHLSTPQPETLRALAEMISGTFEVVEMPEHPASLIAFAYLCFLRDELDFTATFDAARYLALNPDVRKARVNPYEHFLRHGLREARRYR